VFIDATYSEVGMAVEGDSPAVCTNNGGGHQRGVGDLQSGTDDEGGSTDTSAGLGTEHT
jgi:hypothetical protein